MEEEEAKPESAAELIDDMLALRLSDCGESSRRGMADQGFPAAMAKLAALGLVSPSGAGFMITEFGINYLKARHRKNSDAA